MTKYFDSIMSTITLDIEKNGLHYIQTSGPEVQKVAPKKPTSTALLWYMFGNLYM